MTNSSSIDIDILQGRWSALFKAKYDLQMGDGYCFLAHGLWSAAVGLRLAAALFLCVQAEKNGWRGGFRNRQ
jgi:hypothetical protein